MSDDADLEAVIAGIKMGGYYNAGQDCTAACRIYAAGRIYDRFVADLERRLKGGLDVVEPTGADTLVFARIGNQRICGAFADRYSFRPGERIALAPRLEAVHLFDAQSGVNLML